LRSCASPRVSGRTAQKAISLRCPKIRAAEPKGSTQPNFALNSHTLCVSIVDLTMILDPNPFQTAFGGGARRDRTDDILLAKQALSQLSYGPIMGATNQKSMVGPGRLELPTSRLSGVRSNHLSYGPQASAWTETCRLRAVSKLSHPDQNRDRRKLKASRLHRTCIGPTRWRSQRAKVQHTACV
jgi:hypothetical protein